MRMWVRDNWWGGPAFGGRASNAKRNTPQTDVKEPRSAGGGRLLHWPVLGALRLGNEYQPPGLLPARLGPLLKATHAERYCAMCLAAPRPLKLAAPTAHTTTTRSWLPIPPLNVVTLGAL